MRIHLVLFSLALTAGGVCLNTYAEADEKTYFVYWCRVQETTYRPPIITKLSNIIVAKHGSTKGMQNKAKEWAEKTPAPSKTTTGRDVKIPDDPYMICGVQTNADLDAMITAIKTMKMVRAGFYQILPGASSSEYFDDAIEEIELAAYLEK
jgi:hypothetical protein